MEMPKRLLSRPDMLERNGLRFAPQPDPPEPAKTCMLEARPDAADAQKQLRHLLAPGSLSCRASMRVPGLTRHRALGIWERCPFHS